jgi:hypothetical protein
MFSSAYLSDRFTVRLDLPDWIVIPLIPDSVNLMAETDRFCIWAIDYNIEMTLAITPSSLKLASR